jgi:peptidoglycan/xylan/chitin deacetylase (PgdA/CDA1 family)
MNNVLKKSVHHLKRQFVSGALILVYHRISESALDPWSLSVRPDRFTEHLAVLRRSFHPTSLQALAQSLRAGAKPKQKSVVVTFDDGYADNLQQAQPLLERFECPATVFLVTGTIGSFHGFWWDELASLLLNPYPLPERLDLTILGKPYSWQLGEAGQFRQVDYSRFENWRTGQPAPTVRHELYIKLWQLLQPLSSEEQCGAMNALRAWVGKGTNPPTHRILTQKECVELAQAEQIEIGAHTIHHPPLTSMPSASQRNEILGSKQELEKLLKQPVLSFSYPFGKQKDYGPEAIALVQEAGFSVACCNESGVVNSRTDPFQLPRIHIPDCSGADFENRLLSKFHA